MKIKYEFSASTKHVGCEVTEIMEIEVDDDATEEEIEDVVRETFGDWISMVIDSGWRKVE